MVEKILTAAAAVAAILGFFLRYGGNGKRERMTEGKEKGGSSSYRPN